MLAALIGAAVALGPAESPAASPTGRERVGAVFLEGNTRTEDAAILPFLALYPGAELPSEADRLRMELRLLMAFHRRFDLDAGLRPRIEIERNELGSDFVDVRIRFPEKGPKTKRGG